MRDQTIIIKRRFVQQKFKLKKKKDFVASFHANDETCFIKVSFFFNSLHCLVSFAKNVSEIYWIVDEIENHKSYNISQYTISPALNYTHSYSVQFSLIFFVTCQHKTVRNFWVKWFKNV